MISSSPLAHRFITLCIAALAALAMGVVEVSAQSANCQQLAAALASLERNNDFRGLSGASNELRSAQSQVQREESSYVRSGCNELARRGQPLPRQCQAIAQRVLAARQAVQTLQQQVSTGNAVEQQREALLQQGARFRCNLQSNASVNRQQGRGNIFEQLFGTLQQGWDGGGGFRFEQWGGRQGYHTVRTVCVRKSDGYFWPISYSTLEEYAYNDALVCSESCPGVDVELYLYDNPGQEPEQMRNLNGEQYTLLPTAFKYREVFDKDSSCKTATTAGSISLVSDDGGRSRAIVQFGELSFPLPLRDPRRPATVVMATAAQVDASRYVEIPLPRRRPAAPGETPHAVALPAPASTAASAEPMRLVQFGDKTVRIVGPETPYALAAQAGT